MYCIVFQNGGVEKSTIFYFKKTKEADWGGGMSSVLEEVFYLSAGV